MEGKGHYVMRCTGRMKISESTEVKLDLKTIISVIIITASFVGMYYTLQKDIEEAKHLPPSEIKRLEYDLKFRTVTIGPPLGCK